MPDFTTIGFDYGIKPHLILMGDIEFSGYFLEANCMAMLYAFEGYTEADAIPVQLMFLFKNETPAIKFFDCLLRWVEKSNKDGDAVAIEFIEHNAGGYTVAIAPEVTRFIKRMIPEHLKDRVSPIMMIQTHFKQIDALGGNYLKFKKNYKKAGKIVIGYAIGTPHKIEKQGSKYFTKTEFNFYNEDHIPDNSLLLSYKATKAGGAGESEKLPKPPKASLVEIRADRLENLKIFLPITYHKLSNRWLGELQDELSSTYDSDAILQAIANLVIFERLSKEKDWPVDFPKEKYANRILDYLLVTYESFGSYYPPDDFFTEEKVIRQINSDERELQIFLKK